MAPYDKRDIEVRREEGKDISFIGLIAILILALTTLLQLVAVATDHWVDTVSEEEGVVGYSGLWTRCTDYGYAQDGCRGFTWQDVQVSHWFRTVQAMESIGMAGAATALVMMCLHAFVRTCRGNGYLKLFSIGLTALCSVFILVAGVVIGALKDVQKSIELPDTWTQMSWSFGISISSGILLIAASVACCIA